MEKRALLAFVLSIVVIVLWEIFMVPNPSINHPQGERKGASPKSISRSVPIPPKRVPSSEKFPFHSGSVVTGGYRTWAVESPLFRVKISSLGARIEHFELKKHRTKVETNSPFVDLVTGRQGGYLPVALDFLHHQQWQMATAAFNCFSPPKVQLNRLNKKASLAFWTEILGQVRVEKVFSFTADNYILGVNIKVRNVSQKPVSDQMGISFYYRPYGWPDKEGSFNQSHITVRREGSNSDYSIKKIAKKKLTFTAPLEWLAYQDNYFIQAIIPVRPTSYQIVARVIDPQTELVQVAFLPPPFTLSPGQEKEFQMKLFMGPKESDYLKAADHNLSSSVDFGWFTFLAVPLLEILKWLYKYTHNYGVAIIILTVIIKVLFWPLTHKSYKSMQKLKKLQPKMAEIREKYKNDPQKLNQELLMLYRTYNVNPLGGCLPMILQIPVFFALYRMLYGTIELRHQPFCLWINDLTAPDRLPVGFSIPYLGGLPVLTILMGLSMFIQQKMTPMGGDPQQEKMMLMMPIIFTIFFIHFPSGLVLYWLVNNVLSIVQQCIINRKAA